MNATRLTIGITTRDRPEALQRCLRSLALVAHLVARSARVRRCVLGTGERAASPPGTCRVPVRVIRDDRAPGVVVGRNRLVREAAAPVVLLMDDDAAFLEQTAIEAALQVARGRPSDCRHRVRAMRPHRRRWDDRMQPGRSRVACYVAAFIGFAHLVRRDLFTAVGGYRESFVINGEEKELCLRLLDAGYRTVYLPDAVVIHQPDPASRSEQRYLRRSRGTIASRPCTTSRSAGSSGSSRRVWRSISACAARGTSTTRGGGRGSCASCGGTRVRVPRIESLSQSRPCEIWKRLEGAGAVPRESVKSDVEAREPVEPLNP